MCLIYCMWASRDFYLKSLFSRLQADAMFRKIDNVDAKIDEIDECWRDLER